MQFDQGFRYCEPEARALVAFGQLTFHLLEWTAELRKSILGDADAAVQDGERYATITRSSTNSDAPAIGRKFYCV